MDNHHRPEPLAATPAAARVQLLSRPEGRIAYTVTGTGPLLVLVPGMGDLRSTWRELVDPLVRAGYRVAVTDLRGQGDSDPTVTHHGDVESADDVVALVRHLGEGPAVLVGNSMGASVAALASAEAPDLVAGLVLVAPFLRDPAVGRATKAVLPLLYRAMFARPWGAAAWGTYYRSTLNKGVKAPWLGEHVRQIRTNLREPGRLRSFRDLTLALTHAPVEARLADMHAPAIAFVGELDPDFSDPAAELTFVEASIDARGVLVPGVGHYPQHQAPEVVLPATLEFLAGLPRSADRWTVARA